MSYFQLPSLPYKNNIDKLINTDNINNNFFINKTLLLYLKK